MKPDYQIGALWMRGPLSFLEQLCLVSFRDAGHHVVLYTYDEVTGIPDGIETRDANEVLPETGFLVHERTGSPALHSDLFRYRMLEKGDKIIWADTDAYCVKPFETKTGHFFGWESPKHINGGVLGLPPESEALGQLLEFTRDEFAIPPWYAQEEQDRLQALKDAGTPVHAGEMSWGVWGPHAVTHFLHETGEDKYAFPTTGLYPFSFKDRNLMLRRGFDTSEHITDDTYSIHFYGRRMRRRIEEKEGGIPKRWSLIGKLLNQHGIDPTAAPIPPKRDVQTQLGEGESPMPAPAPTPAPEAAAIPPATPSYTSPFVNLTDLADKYGSDKGSSKHRYTELYNMLFQPYQKRKIRFLEMGLQIGGPEHGKSEDRETTDLPSIRMWLEYFSSAEIIGLDVSDFSWFEADRFQFIRCDMDDRANIEAAAEKIGKVDIIIDDASHASSHQQDAFVTLFPLLKPGGLYIIEDLRWQPQVYEDQHPGITKTADTFQSYLQDGYFSNGVQHFADEMNALRGDFSGCFVFQAQYQKNRKDQVAVIHKK